jgi:hypothetical protein
MDKSGPNVPDDSGHELVDLVEKRHGLVVGIRRDPSAALESAAAVLVRPAESLRSRVSLRVEPVA